MRKVYLAGPDVFLPDAVAVGLRKKALCAKYGFEGLFPFDNEISPNLSSERVDRLIYQANERMITRADFGIFNLTPFRGPSADVGTVFELGMIIGLGKPAFGYTNVTDDFLDRCKQFGGLIFDSVQKTWRDSEEMTVENFANADNLMIDNALIEHGGHSIVRHKTPPHELFRDLTGFETCLRLAAEAISKNRLGKRGIFGTLARGERLRKRKAG
jgi:nucleoside 2-deoxyribosyltransferase